MTSIVGAAIKSIHILEQVTTLLPTAEDQIACTCVVLNLLILRLPPDEQHEKLEQVLAKLKGAHASALAATKGML